MNEQRTTRRGVHAVSYVVEPRQNRHISRERGDHSPYRKPNTLTQACTVGRLRDLQNGPESAEKQWEKIRNRTCSSTEHLP